MIGKLRDYVQTLLVVVSESGQDVFAEVHSVNGSVDFDVILNTLVLALAAQLTNTDMEPDVYIDLVAERLRGFIKFGEGDEKVVPLFTKLVR